MRVCVLLLALMLRFIALIFLFDHELMPDEQDFLGIADSISHEHAFRSPFSGYHHARGPVYPCLLAAAVFPATARILQCLIDSATAGLLMLLAARLGLSRRAQLLAGTLWAINPYAIYFSQLYLSETLFCFLLVASLLTESPVLLGLLALTRSIGAGTAALLLWRRPRALFVFALVLYPWILRNITVWGTVTLGPQGGTLWESLNPEADGGPGASVPVDVDGYWAHQAWVWAYWHPLSVVTLAVEKQRRFWSPIPNYKKFQRFPWILAGLYELPLIVLAGFGAARFRGRLLAVVTMYPCVHLIILGSLRYRMPIEPLLCLFAAAWVSEKEEEGQSV